jgi:hypothetical protein
VAAPVDTVTLSRAAQQSLAAAAPAVDPSQPADVTQAIATLNDTSGDVSANDQWNAFALLANFVQGPQVAASIANDIATGKVTSPPENGYTAAKGNAIVALIDSPFGQRVQRDENQVGLPERVQDTNGGAIAASVDASTAAFNALSATDQQIYIDAANLGNQLEGQKANFATPADFVAYQQAQANVDRALQAAISSPTYATALTQTPQAQSFRTIAQVSGGLFDTTEGFGNKVEDLATLATAAGDQATAALANIAHPTTSNEADYTQQVQAYFAKYGPPPAPDGSAPAPALVIPAETLTPPNGAGLNAALAATWDISGDISATDQAAAEQQIRNYSLSDQTSGVANFVVSQLSLSPFENAENAAATNFFFSPAVQAATSDNGNPFKTPSELDLLNGQPLRQQELIFAASGYNTPDNYYVGTQEVYYATLDDWKGYLAQQDAANKAAWQADQTTAATSTASALATAATAAVASLKTAPESVGLSAAQAKQDVAKLTSAPSTDTGATVALKVLRNVAKAATAYKAGNTKATGGATADAGNTASTSAAASAATLAKTGTHRLASTVSVTA